MSPKKQAKQDAKYARAIDKWNAGIKAAHASRPSYAWSPHWGTA